MKTYLYLAGTVVLAIAVLVSVFLFRARQQAPFTMAWDMAAHTYYGAELGQDIRLGRPLSFFKHIYDSSIALWPFLHPLVLGISFAVFGFSEQVPIIVSLVFAVLSVAAAFAVGCFSTGNKSAIAGFLAAFLLLSSPLFLAFSTYPMLEMMGLLLSLAVLICASTAHQNVRHWGTAAAVAMLLLFLVKINYGLYLFLPWLIYEALSLDETKRRKYQDLLKRFLNPKSPLLIILAIVLAATIAAWLMALAGIRTHAFLKHSVFAFLVLLFLKILFFHLDKRNETRKILLRRHLQMLHIVVIPVLIWFLIKPDRTWEMLRMSSDRSSGFAAISFSNLLFYPAAFIHHYCCHWFAGIVVLLLFVVSASRWKKKPPVVNLAITAVLFGYAGLTIKLKDFAEPRFFFIQAIFMFIIAGYEIWRIGSDAKKYRLSAYVAHYTAVAVLVLFAALLPVRKIYTHDIKQIIRDGAPASGPYLGEMFRKALDNLDENDKSIAILGGSNELSPYLVRWELIRADPSVIRNVVEPAVKSIESNDDLAEFEKWLREEMPGVVVSLAISDVSPYAQFPDFQVRHEFRQTVVEAMETQKLYGKIAEERWRSMAVEVRIYRPAKNKGPSAEGPD